MSFIHRNNYETLTDFLFDYYETRKNIQAAK